jgi:hypothetical protein
MEPTPSIWQGPELPPGHPPLQLTVRIDLFEERKGGCAVSFGVPEGADLLAKYGRRGQALVACRDILVGELDTLIEEFADEE